MCVSVGLIIFMLHAPPGRSQVCGTGRTDPPRRTTHLTGPPRHGGRGASSSSAPHLRTGKPLTGRGYASCVISLLVCTFLHISVIGHCFSSARPPYAGGEDAPPRRGGAPNIALSLYPWDTACFIYSITFCCRALRQLMFESLLSRVTGSMRAGI